MSCNRALVKIMRATIIMMISFFSVKAFSAKPDKQYHVELNEEAVKAQRFERSGDYEQAIKAYKEGLKAYETNENDMGVLLCLEKIGWLNREINQYGEALEYFEKKVFAASVQDVYREMIHILPYWKGGDVNMIKHN